MRQDRVMQEIRMLGIQRNTPTVIVLSPTLTAVESIGCNQSNPPELCLSYDRGFEAFYNYFLEIMNNNKFPHIDFLKHLVDYGKEGSVKSLYVNKGKDPHHYSPQGNTTLSQAIADRLAADFDMRGV